MYGTPLRQSLEKVRRRLVFGGIAPVFVAEIVPEDNTVTRITNSMAQATLNQHSDIVFFFGYRSSLIEHTPYYCADCIDSVLGFPLRAPFDVGYISTGNKFIHQFVENDFNDKSNYCAKCGTPLYDLRYVDEQCQHCTPSSNKQRQLFHKRRNFGPRHGGS